MVGFNYERVETSCPEMEQPGLGLIPPLERNKNASTTKHGMGSEDSHPSDKNKDVRWMGHSFILQRVGNVGGGLIRNKTGCLELELRGIPPIEQTTLDGWGTPMFRSRGSVTPVGE